VFVNLVNGAGLFAGAERTLEAAEAFHTTQKAWAEQAPSGGTNGVAGSAYSCRIYMGVMSLVCIISLSDVIFLL
jgi:hypothetical protein